MNRSTGILIIIAIALMAGGLSYWTGFLSTETGSGTGTETGSELLEIVNVTSRRSGYVDLTIKNGGTRDARLDYIVANGSVVSEEDHLIPYGAQIDLEIPVDFEPNSLVIMRLHTESGRDFEQTIIIPEGPKFLQVEIPGGWAEWIEEEDGWNIYVDVKNTGAADTLIDGIFVNEGTYPYPELPLKLDSGTTVRLKIFLSSGSHGTRIDIKIHTSHGYIFPVSVKLP